jgi:uncharacterized protein (DUF983 family)
MIIAAIALLALGSIGVGGAVIMEVKTNDPIWQIMMKVAPWSFGVGGVLMGIGLAA